MPWSEVSLMQEKRFFIKDYVEGSFSITELAARYSVSRKTAYKWIGRYVEEGKAGLEDRSRRPHSSPARTDEAIEAEIVTLRKRHPLWALKKLLEVLHRRRPDVDWPARSTVADVLKRNDLIKSKRRRRYPGHPGRPPRP